MKQDSQNLNNIQGAMDFLQSPEWRKFQAAAGRKTHYIVTKDFVANIIEHVLPIVGKYFYCPRGPVSKIPSNAGILNGDAVSHDQVDFSELIALAQENAAGWIRIEPQTEELLQQIKKNCPCRIVRAPHDMQPREIFAIDITKTPEELLGAMKPKTRYNIGLAKKKDVQIKTGNYIDAFLKLTKEMALRQGIATHSSEYYRKMVSTFPDDMLKIYVAEYAGEIIASNLVLFFGKTAVYLHGASGASHRNVMAPFLLQWQAILDAKARGCEMYDFGGVQTPSVKHQKHSDLVGVTHFKMGFSPNTPTIVFPGSYDMIMNSRKYAVYRGLQKAQSFAVKFRR